MKSEYIYIALSTVLFSTMEIALKIFSLGYNPMQMNFIRFLIGSCLLLPFALRQLKKRNIKLCARDFAFFALTGFICVVVSMTFYQFAVLKIRASIVAILFSCNPVFVIPIAYFMLREKITRRTVVSMLLSVAGIVFIMNPLHMNANAAGVLLTLLTAVSFAFYGVTGKLRSGRFGGVALTAFSFLMGSLEMLALIMISRVGFISTALRGAGLGAFSDIPVLRGITLHGLPGLVYIGVFVTGLGYCFYFLAMEKASAATASLVFFIKPALAPVLALIILREPITASMLFGIAFIVAGSCVTFFSSKNKIQAHTASNSH